MDHTINEFLRKKKFEAYNKPGLQSGNRSLGKKMNKRLFFLFFSLLSHVGASRG